MKDNISSIKITTFGELFLRMQVPGGNRFTQMNELQVYTGGAEANVCVLLSQLGINTHYITRVPNNDLSKLTLNELHKYKVDTTDCIYGGERMGLYFVESGNQVRASQVIYDRSNSAFSTINEDDINWDIVLADSTLFHWSGISPGVSLMLRRCARKQYCLLMIRILVYLLILIFVPNYGNMANIRPRLCRSCFIIVQ